MDDSVPEAIDAGAPVISRQRLLIPAARADVWSIHAEVHRWVDWQADIQSASIDGALAAGSTITWRTAGIDAAIASKIYVVEPQRRTLWGAPAMGITGIHEWRFADAEGGTLVETEESWSGAPVEADITNMEKILDASLQKWLHHLRCRATA